MDTADRVDGLQELKALSVKSSDLPEMVCDSSMTVKPLKIKSLKNKPHQVKSTIPEAKDAKEDDEEEESKKSVNVYSDLCGKLVTSLDGNKYFKVSFVSGIAVIYIETLPSREAKAVVDNSVTIIKKLKGLGFIVKHHVSDRAKELECQLMIDSLRDLGVEIQTTAGYDSNANAYAERAIRTILESTCVTMHSKRVPSTLWDYCLQYVCYIKNYLIRIHQGKSLIPMEELTGERCSIPEHVYIFGSYAWAMVPGNDNVQERNLECMYLGPGGIVHKRGAMFVPLESIRNGQVKDNLFEDRDCGLDYMLEDWFVDSEDLGDTDYVPEQPDERVIQRAKRSNAQIQEDNEDIELKENGSDIENSGLRRSNRPKKSRSAENYYLIDLTLIDVITVQEALESEDRKSWEEAINSEFKSI